MSALRYGFLAFLISSQLSCEGNFSNEMSYSVFECGESFRNIKDYLIVKGPGNLGLHKDNLSVHWTKAPGNKIRVSEKACIKLPDLSGQLIINAKVDRVNFSGSIDLEKALPKILVLQEQALEPYSIHCPENAIKERFQLEKLIDASLVSKPENLLFELKSSEKTEFFKYGRAEVDLPPASQNLSLKVTNPWLGSTIEKECSIEIDSVSPVTSIVGAEIFLPTEEALVFDRTKPIKFAFSEDSKNIEKVEYCVIKANEKSTFCKKILTTTGDTPIEFPDRKGAWKILYASTDIAGNKSEWKRSKTVILYHLSELLKVKELAISIKQQLSQGDASEWTNSLNMVLEQINSLRDLPTKLERTQARRYWTLTYGKLLSNPFPQQEAILELKKTPQSITSFNDELMIAYVSGDIEIRSLKDGSLKRSTSIDGIPISIYMDKHLNKVVIVSNKNYYLLDSETMTLEGFQRRSGSTYTNSQRLLFVSNKTNLMKIDSNTNQIVLLRSFESEIEGVTTDGEKFAVKLRNGQTMIGLIDEPSALINSLEIAISPDGFSLSKNTLAHIKNREYNGVINFSSWSSDPLLSDRDVVTDFPPEGIVFSQNSEKVGIHGKEKLLIYDYEKGIKIFNSFSPHRGSLLDFVFTSDGSRFVTVGSDRTLRIWLNETLNLDFLEISSEHNHRDLSISSDEKQIVTASDSGIMVYEKKKGSFDQKQIKTREALSVAKIDASRYMIGFLDRSIEIWDISTAQKLLGPLKFEHNVSQLFKTPKGILAHVGKKLLLIDDNLKANLLYTDTIGIDAVAVAKDGSAAVISNSKGDLSYIDFENGKSRIFEKHHKSLIYGLAIDENRQRVYSGDFDGILLEWNLSSGKILRRYPNQVDSINHISLNSDGNILAVSSMENFILWDTNEGKEIVSSNPELIGNEVLKAQFSPNSNLLFTLGEEWTLKAWDYRPSAIKSIICSIQVSQITKTCSK